MRILVVNAGSTSTKLRTIAGDDQVEASVDLHGLGPAQMAERIREFADSCGPIGAAGHRVVHGGDQFRDPVIVDARVRADLESLSELAPLHNPPALVGIDALGLALPEVENVACFDTAWHAGLPAAASRYALPIHWIERWPMIRRYGFHGLSCEWATARVGEMLGRSAERGRVVICHLGGGASVTAVVGGRSVDTTMGFTPLEGLVMGSRPGDVDPGVLTWMLGHGLTLGELEEGLEHASGLLGLSGGSSGDMQELLARRSHSDRVASAAVEVYLHRLAAKVAAMAAAAGGLDTLVFTGGIGENSPEIRAETARRLAWMGVAIDQDRNQLAGREDCDLSEPGSSVSTLVVHAREDLVIARSTRRTIDRG